MGEVAVARNEDGVHHTSQKRRIGMSRLGQQEEVSNNRQDDQLSWRADAINRKAAQQLFDVVAMGAEDEMLVAEERYSNGNWLRYDGRDVSNQGLATMRKEMAEQDHEARVECERDDRVRGADHQKADDLARRKYASQRSECTVSLWIGRRLDWRKGVQNDLSLF